MSLLKATREQVIAYRVAAQGLHRTDSQLDDLAVLDLGVQDSTGASARLAFDARLPQPPPAQIAGLALAWTLRGAPHWHRRDALPGLAGALYPLSDADAAKRLGETGARLAKGGRTGLEVFDEGVAAIRASVDKAMAKGAASTAITKAGPDAINRACRACGTTHVSELVMRLGALQAGIELEPETSPPVLVPSFEPGPPDAGATGALAAGYLALLGPATVGDAAGFLDARRADVEAVTPDGLVEVDVEGRTCYLPAECADVLHDAPPPELVRLLGPYDPYLQARDRMLIVPDKAVHKALWPILGRPGVVFADGEVVGTWRPKASGKRLTLTVETFAPQPDVVWSAIEEEAARVGAVRGIAEVSVSRR